MLNISCFQEREGEGEREEETEAEGERESKKERGEKVVLDLDAFRISNREQLSGA